MPEPHAATAEFNAADRESTAKLVAADIIAAQFLTTEFVTAELVTTEFVAAKPADARPLDAVHAEPFVDTVDAQPAIDAGPDPDA